MRKYFHICPLIRSLSHSFVVVRPYNTITPYYFSIGTLIKTKPNHFVRLIQFTRSRSICLQLLMLQSSSLPPPPPPLLPLSPHSAAAHKHTLHGHAHCLFSTTSFILVPSLHVQVQFHRMYCASTCISMYTVCMCLAMCVRSRVYTDIVS